MKYPKTNGGVAVYRDRFSDDALNVFGIAVGDRRARFALVGDQLRGPRFKSNQDVLARLESMFSEEDFLRCPGPSIDAALADAAGSDWWYTYEKDYGWPHIVEDENGEGDDE